MEIERANIWGKPGCELPNGKICNACCVLLNIELAGVYASVAKPENSPCPHLYGQNGEDADKQGCDLHFSGKSDNCKNWHCSMTSLNRKLDLIAQGLSLGLVTEAEAFSSASTLLGGRQKKNNDSAGIIQDMILAGSVMLSKITYPKELIERDLDEI